MIALHLHKTLHGQKGPFQLTVAHELTEGSITALYGPSGAGKTSLLRIVAGLLAPDHGEIIVGQQRWFSSQDKVNVKTQQRSIGYVFQEYALFPNMTVKENIAFAVKKGESRNFADELISMTGLNNLVEKKPYQLSGGQQQRVALARALARKPSLLLLDEPFSSLDREFKSELQDMVLMLHKKLKTTTLLVTHDVSEVYKMADEVFLLEEGKVNKKGSPSEVFSGQQLSGKFQFTGELINIEKEDVVYLLSILIGQNITKVIATEKEVSELKVGDQLLVASKAFNPVIKKIG